MGTIITLNSDYAKRISDSKIELMIVADGNTCDIKDKLKNAGYKWGNWDKSQSGHEGTFKYWYKIMQIDREFDESIYPSWDDILHFVQDVLNDCVREINDTRITCYQYDFERQLCCGECDDRNPDRFCLFRAGYRQLADELECII